MANRMFLMVLRIHLDLTKMTLTIHYAGFFCSHLQNRVEAEHVNMRETEEFDAFRLPVKAGMISRGENKNELFPCQVLGAVFLLHCHKFYGYSKLADEMEVGKVFTGTDPFLPTHPAPTSSAK